MKIFGVKVDEVSLQVAVDRVSEVLGAKRTSAYFIVTPNPEQVMQAQDDRDFLRTLNRADLAIADGVGLVWASRVLRSKVEGVLPTRVSGVDLMSELIRLADEEKYKVMLVGGRGETARRAAQKLQMSNDKLQVKGVKGIRNIKNPDKKEEKELLEAINDYKPDLLFVGFGAPWQEKWVAKHRKRLKVKVVMVVGGAFDQLVDPSLRPPRVLDMAGLGWLYRLMRQPWRLGRQMRLVKFGWMVAKGALL